MVFIGMHGAAYSTHLVVVVIGVLWSAHSRHPANMVWLVPTIVLVEVDPVLSPQ